MPWEEIEALLLAVKTFCDIQPLTVTSHEKAIEIAKRFQLSFYDANIHSGMLIDGIRIQNPF